jgi:hypothetical protein
MFETAPLTAPTIQLNPAPTNNNTSLSSIMGAVGGALPYLDIAKSLVGAVSSLFAGRTYTTGQYVLGERYLDHVAGEKPDYGRGDVSDPVVPLATTFFTFAFGVRITTSEDLDALDYGATAYYARPEKSDVPRNAVERAVTLKKTYYPIATYNKGKWNLEYLFKTPYVAPIPGVAYRTLMEARLSDQIVIKQGILQGQALPVLQAATSNQIGFSGMPELTNTVHDGGTIQEPGTTIPTVKRWFQQTWAKVLILLIPIIAAGAYLLKKKKIKK